MKKIKFTKYQKRGPGYHWILSGLHPLRSNAFIRARYKYFLLLLKKQLLTIKGKSVLDIGCGDGVLIYKFAKEGAVCSGIDLSFDAVKYAKHITESKGYNISLSSGSCEKIHYKSNIFDIIVCSDVIEHLENPHLLLQEVKRLLKRGGIAVISTPLRLTSEPADKCHVQEWFEDEFAELIQSTFNDYKIIKSHPLFWYELFLKHRIARVLINLFSIIKNPFISTSSWNYYTLQYVVIENK